MNSDELYYRDQRLCDKNVDFKKSKNLLKSSLFGHLKGASFIILYYRVKDRNVIYFFWGIKLFKI